MENNEKLESILIDDCIFFILRRLKYEDHRFKTLQELKDFILKEIQKRENLFSSEEK